MVEKKIDIEFIAGTRNFGIGRTATIVMVDGIIEYNETPIADWAIRQHYRGI